MCVHAHAYARTRVYTHMCVHAYTYIHTYIHACMHAYIHMCVHAYTRICVYTHVYTRVCTHEKFVHARVHAREVYTHTRARSHARVLAFARARVLAFACVSICVQASCAHRPLCGCQVPRFTSDCARPIQHAVGGVEHRCEGARRACRDHATSAIPCPTVAAGRDGVTECSSDWRGR